MIAGKQIGIADDTFSVIHRTAALVGIGSSTLTTRCNFIVLGSTEYLFFNSGDHNEGARTSTLLTHYAELS
jgi:hypothetical protein